MYFAYVRLLALSCLFFALFPSRLAAYRAPAPAHRNRELVDDGKEVLVEALPPVLRVALAAFSRPGLDPLLAAGHIRALRQSALLSEFELRLRQQRGISSEDIKGMLSWLLRYEMMIKDCLAEYETTWLSCADRASPEVRQRLARGHLSLQLKHISRLLPNQNVPNLRGHARCGVGGIFEAWASENPRFTIDHPGGQLRKGSGTLPSLASLVRSFALEGIARCLNLWCDVGCLDVGARLPVDPIFCEMVKMGVPFVDTVMPAPCTAFWRAKRVASLIELDESSQRYPLMAHSLCDAGLLETPTSLPTCRKLFAECAPEANTLLAQSTLVDFLIGNCSGMDPLADPPPVSGREWGHGVMKIEEWLLGETRASDEQKMASKETTVRSGPACSAQMATIIRFIKKAVFKRQMVTQIVIEKWNRTVREAIEADYEMPTSEERLLERLGRVISFAFSFLPPSGQYLLAIELHGLFEDWLSKTVGISPTKWPLSRSYKCLLRLVGETLFYFPEFTNMRFRDGKTPAEKMRDNPLIRQLFEKGLAKGWPSPVHQQCSEAHKRRLQDCSARYVGECWRTMYKLRKFLLSKGVRAHLVQDILNGYVDLVRSWSPRCVPTRLLLQNKALCGRVIRAELDAAAARRAGTSPVPSPV
jgi:hypothetical protein